MLLFLEGIPLYLKTTWSHLHFGEEDQTGRSSNIHSAHSVMQVVLHDQEGAFVSKLDTFVSTRLDSHRPIEEREASAVVNALWSLFDQNVLPYTDATSFLHPGKHVIAISPGWRLEIYLDRVGQQFPSLSVLQQHLELMATFRCAQRRDSKYPSKHWGQRWPFSHLGNLPRKLEDPELNPFCDEILSLLRDESVINESGRWGMHSRSADVIAAETNRGITLLGLCVYFWKDTALSSDDFTDHYFGRIMQQLPRFVSSLTVGSAGAQRAYSAAILLVTVVLERADLDLHHKDRYRSKLSPLLDPLVNISDDIAARNAQRIFCSPLWFRYLSRWKIPPRWLENPTLNQILGSAELRRYLQIRWYLPDSILRSRMPEQVVPFAGMHSSMQNELLEPLKRWLTKGLPVISPDDVEAVFRLLVLLDDPKAVLHVQRALVQFLSTAAPSNVHERKMEAAREALGQLKVTASKPGFIFKALSLPDF
ncbi:hypothetical protein C8J56DRAFT_468754 [Mycena floridula]|nr:hypothetical protein C8J56DRAFT_468754 [Mycena floridula]